MGFLFARPTLLLWGLLGAVLMASAVGLWWQGQHINRLQDALTVERANTAILRSSIAEQNAAVDRAAAAGRQRQGRAAEAIERAPVARPRVTEAMKSPPRGATTGDRVEDIDRRFLESLR